MFHTGTQPTFIDKEQTAHANQWQNIINYTICQQGAKYVGLVHGIGQGDQEYGFKYADAAGNLAENAGSLGNRKQPHKYNKRYFYKWGQTGIKYQTGQNTICYAKNCLRKRHAC